MKDKYCLIALGIAFVIFSIIHKVCKNKKPVSRAFLSMFTGFLALIAVNVSGIYSGVTLPYSMLTITVSTIGGIPGVTSLLALNLFF